MEFLRDSKGHFSTTKRVHSKAKNCANLKKIERVISSPRHPVYPDSNLSNFDSFTPAAGSTFCDHSYLHSSSFDDINNDFFGGRLKPLTFCRFVVDLQTFFDSMTCSQCEANLDFKDAIGVYPAGISGHLIVKCRHCFELVRVCMGKMHRRDGVSTGPMAFDVNTKLSTASEHIGIGPTQLNNFLTALNLPYVSKTLLKKGYEETGPALNRVAQRSIDRALQEEAVLTIGELSLEDNLQSSSAVASTESRSEYEQEPVPDEFLYGGPQDLQGESSKSHTPTVEITETLDQTHLPQTLPAAIPSQNLKGELPFGGPPDLPTESTESHTLNLETSETKFPGIVASADGAYQRRGSGRSYNSLSGTASLIGRKTGKVLAFTSRCKRCRICSVSKRKGKLPKPHQCMKNWSGSAKGMEGDMIVEMLRSVKERKVPVATLIGDDDTTGFTKARQEVFETLKKVSDTNHVKKNISNKLYQLKPKYKELSIKSINAIMKSFGYLLGQAKGNPEAIRSGMPAVVLHQFGLHNNCGNWCRLKDNTTARHRNLPWGADLQNSQLKKELLAIFSNLDVNKLSKMDSTNRNESFNNIVRSKAPKDKHYSESGSLNRRLAAAACQKNNGYGYVPEVHEEIGLSPGNMTSVCARIRDADVERQRKRSRTKKYKLRRLELKSERSTETRSAEVREGDTYNSNIMDGTKEPDEEQIPGPSSNVYESDERTLVYYDLETTGLGRNSCLIQIAAVHGDSTFSRYVTPLQPISDGAKIVTGICYNADSNEMTHSGVKVQHFHPVNILLDFIEFIKGVRTKVVLVAHNNKAFDSCVLYNQLKLHNLWSSFCKFTVGFCDTLPFFKLIYPEAVNHKQVTLAKEILGEEYVAHNAVEDCTMLKKLVLKTCKESILAERFFFSVQQMTSHGVEARPESVEWLFKNNIISKAISKKITDSGLSYDHLKLAFERNGYDGLYYLLSEADSNTGKPRVTKNHSVVKKVVNHFSMPQ